MSLVTRFRFVALGLITLGLLLALPGGALAAKPSVDTNFRNKGTTTLDCGNGTVLSVAYVFALRVTTFFDNSGSPIRVTVHISESDVITNPTNGKTVTIHAANTVRFDLASDTTTQTGLAFLLHTANPPAVIHIVGRIVFDADGNVIFEAGSHDLEDPQGAICAAVA